jgi:hypothetical protein
MKAIFAAIDDLSVKPTKCLLMDGNEEFNITFHVQFKTNSEFFAKPHPSREKIPETRPCTCPRPPRPSGLDSIGTLAHSDGSLGWPKANPYHRQNQQSRRWIVVREPACSRRQKNPQDFNESTVKA